MAVKRGINLYKLQPMLVCPLSGRNLNCSVYPFLIFNDVRIRAIAIVAIFTKCLSKSGPSSRLKSARLHAELARVDRARPP